MKVYQKFLEYRSRGEKCLLVLLDPDKTGGDELCARAVQAQAAGAKAVLMGGSHLETHNFNELIGRVKREVEIPLVIFPGGSSQVSEYADAILFLSLISGRNPYYLIGEHVNAALRVRKSGLEAIPTAYMLIESGKLTAIEYVSNTKPIPRDQAGVAVAHAVAGQMLGMKLVYLEAGSGAKLCVPADMVAAVAENIEIPLIVGGGIRKPQDAQEAARAGADFIVVGNVLEEAGGDKLLPDIVAALKG